MPKIIGIDPGLAFCGWGVIELTSQSLPSSQQSYSNRKMRFTAGGEVRSSASEPLCSRLKLLYDQLHEMFLFHAPVACSVEELYMNKNVTSALPVAHARGVALLCAAQLDIPVYEYTANRIKQAVTGYGKASKHQVREMVRFLLGVKPSNESKDSVSVLKSNHCSDALAAAICFVLHKNGASEADVNPDKAIQELGCANEKLLKIQKSAPSSKTTPEFEALLAKLVPK